MNKIIRINMSADQAPSITEEGLGNYAGLGGRAMTSAVVSKEVPPLCHPLGEDNKLVIAPGILSGSAAVMSGRLSIGCKSPLTGGIKESNAGGQPSQMLGRLGYAAIIIEGKPKDDTLYKIIITSQGITIQPDNSLRMLGNYDLVSKIKEEFGEKIACISIGPAGEMKMSAATIACTDPELRPTRHAGRGGTGAVMGAKGVKVIVIDDTGASFRPPSDPDLFKEANKTFTKGIKEHPVTGEGLPALGTNVLTNVLNEAGAYPTFNFKEGRFKSAAKISGEALAELETTRNGKATHGCQRGCIIQCSGIFNDKDGNYVSKQPEYETVWAHGGNCGIDDLDTIAKLDRMDDDFGVDTMEMGTAIAVAMDAGLAAFGDGEAAINMIKEVGKGTSLGRIIGNGAAFTGKAFGVERVPVVKGQAMAAYDPRGVQGIGVTYATSPMGADHTAGYSVATNILGIGGNVNPLLAEGQVDLSRNLQIATAGLDSLGLCLFVAMAILDNPDAFGAMVTLVKGLTGKEFTPDDFNALGLSVLKNERDFNLRAGLTSKDDRLPEFFKKEKLATHDIVFMVEDEDLDQVFDKI
ncbi:MAG: aldehyde ferredoxin oxidoreductase [Proteobacteria bacterium]|nr:aldehyde ferredoxin oxidoreductase [Pseudomonadota bacterium]MBU1582096.1 aldehyde ferredoxin oxidoreductase [Pseudomonadota bacterium]MBU2631321.1 aldehyde ferredoxin oxidoreductase [Pseudomonadota bacterium]